MKIKTIYKKEGNFWVSLTISLLCVCITLISAIKPSVYESLAYAYPIRNPWQILTGLFLHGSPNLSLPGCIGHLLFNLILVLPFGIMIEKLIGSKRFLLITVIFWVVNLATFYTIAAICTPNGENTFGAGISGIAFSYGIIGLFILIQMFKLDKKDMLKQISFYLLLNIILIMLIMINPFVAGVTSMIVHLVAVVAGIIFILIKQKVLKEFIEDNAA
mgnify:CR=1 FL=1